MGLLDSMLGGGTKLALSLDTPQSSPGGVVGGKLSLQGGKKPLKLTELTVKLLFVSVQSRTGQALPDIKTEIMLTQTIAAGEDLPPGAVRNYTFRFTVPGHAQTSAHNVSFTVMAVADIPGVKDPSASAELQIVEAANDEHRLLPVEEIFSRFPGLRSRDESTLTEALREVFLACYSEASQLQELEPYLANLMRQGTQAVRLAALEAWANLVDNRVKPHHLETLYAVANTPGLDQDTFDQVIVAACKFAEEGAYHLVQQLAVSQDSHVRRELANGLRFQASAKFNGKRELLIGLAQDPDPQVRAAAIGAFADYRDDQQIMYGVAGQIERDPDPEVQAACISALSLAHYHGMAELTLAVYEKHLANPNVAVRKEIAGSIHSLPKEQLQRIWGIVQKLLADQDEDVRRAMAFQFANFSELPQLLPLAQHVAQNDPSPDVRYEATGSMAAMMQPDQVAGLYSQLLARDPSEPMAWAALNGLRRHDEHPATKKMLTQLAQSPYSAVAEAARDALTR
ncbi:MAG: HEAT repeat domain-containing protein [Deltaproteobacteria bacterium]|nr:HEAT repeat domain-containing protein [Deltaproteobacteria bacterium]